MIEYMGETDIFLENKKIKENINQIESDIIHFEKNIWLKNMIF